jgi:cytoskeletal protein CcmA (bactofilin family)
MSTTFGQAVTVKGTIQATEAVSISGHVIGDVVAMNHVVVIETDGRVEGTVTAREVAIHGACSGRLVATGIVRLHPGCQVKADIASPKVAIEEGAVFNGRAEPGKAEAAARVAAYRQGT